MRRRPAVLHAGGVRVALVAETFLPQMNGVVGSLLHTLRHLHAHGHEALVIAPRHDESPAAHVLHGAELARLRSLPTPGYPELRLTVTTPTRLAGILRGFRPDVVHLASPFLLGWSALRAAETVGVPTVAVYQTDVPGYAQRYGIPALAPAFARHVARIHRRADLTLAPSTPAIADLAALGVDRVERWARGVDLERFRPGRRDEAWRRALAPHGELLVGFVGRLAPEKQVLDLEALAGIRGIRLVIIGDGPERAAVQQAMPDAHLTGFLGGDDLARAVASLDVFVHPGENETFCQTVQEALASGVPVVATGAGGPLDLVQHDRTGYLYRPGDLDDLRARVQTLVDEPARRAAFAAAARPSVAHRTWGALGDELLQHYRSVIDAGLAKGLHAA